MQTRSVTNYEKNAPYEVNIDFDEASKLWKINKLSASNGTYTYVCEKICISGKKCNKKCLSGKEFCGIHMKSN